MRALLFMSLSLVPVLFTPFATRSVSAQDPASPAASKKAPAKAQHEVAAKDVVLKEITAIDAASAGAIAASDLATLRKRDGKETTISGKVTTVFAPDSKSIVLLNFARNYKDAIVVGIKANRFAAFPDLRTLKDKTVVVTGVVILYKERPEILLETPSQIRVVKSSENK
ncbi:MAG: hypothetical protein ACOVT5_08710 [Armatimonadaceae bacterium]